MRAKVQSLIDRLARRAGYQRAIGEPPIPPPIQALMQFRDLLPSDSEFRTFLRFASANVDISHSQVFQDLFVLFHLKEKRNGFFVEFGATDGVFLSNTILLEQNYSWKGIVAEPSKNWHAALLENRTCQIDLRCVWDKSGDRLNFIETRDAEYSTISEFKDADHLAMVRANHHAYFVETVSLNDLLDFYKAPSEIDYLSIDTEGSELKILEAFDFKKRSFGVITVEHNFVPSPREALFSLLTNHGYRRVLTGSTLWDDWYVLK